MSLRIKNTEGGFAEALLAHMNKADFDIRKLALESGATYEHIRKLVKGIALPSNVLLRSICTVLKWNVKDAERLVATDQVKKKYGNSLPKEMTGIDPALQPFTRVIPQLGEREREILLAQARAMLNMKK